MESLLAGQDLWCARPIVENIAFLGDVVDLTNEYNLPVVRLSLDQEKTFDRVDWPFLFATPAKMGLGDNFIRWVKMSMVSPLALSSLPVGCVRVVPCPPYCMSSPWKCSLPYVPCYPDNRELKQLRRRPQRQRQKTIGLMIKTTTLHVHHAFQYISLTSTARLRHETS